MPSHYAEPTVYEDIAERAEADLKSLGRVPAIKFIHSLKVRSVKGMREMPLNEGEKLMAYAFHRACEHQRSPVIKVVGEEGNERVRLGQFAKRTLAGLARHLIRLEKAERAGRKGAEPGMFLEEK